MFHPSEVELTETTQTLLADVEKIKPARVVFDSLSELRLLAGNPLRYRRQILGLKQFFAGRRCTALLLDDLTATDRDLQVHSVSHGVISLEQLNPEYGADRRRLRIAKLRGKAFRSGYHDYIIRPGGLSVFPRLIARDHLAAVSAEKLSSGLPELDTLLGGGIERGTSMLLIGAAGTGKSTVAAQFATAAAKRGQHAALFIFDESVQTLLTRTAGMGIDLKCHIDTQHIGVRQVDPAELSPGEFAHSIRTAVERDNAAIVVIDSLNGYLNAMPNERFLIVQLHELLSYLGQQGVATVMVGAHQGVIGTQMTSTIDASYLADAVLLLRYFEARGKVRQAISCVKKRGGAHERTIREFRLASDGIHVGPALSEFRGVLTGVPIFEGGGGSPGERSS
jgi:circadian clock protein KaiC